MKLLEISIALFGIFVLSSASTWKWDVGKEYVWNYSGRLLSGIPALSTQYSGIGIRCIVRLQVSSLDDVKMSLENVSFSKVNDVLSQSGNIEKSTNGHIGWSWRNLILPDFKLPDVKMTTLLSLPLKFSISNGEISSLSISKDEETWSSNFKKALIILFQTKVEKTVLDVSSNTINKDADELINYWKVNEETLDGWCDIIYQVNELPDYFIKENEKLLPKMSLCPAGSKYYEVSKIKDSKSCRMSAVYSFLKPSYTGSCSSPRCLGRHFGTASSVTRYYACGSRSNLVLLSLVNEGENIQRLTAFKTESTITGTRQTLSLENIVPIGAPLPEPLEPRVLESLTYEYFPHSSMTRSQRSSLPLIPSSEMTQGTMYRYLPRHFFPNPSTDRSFKEWTPEKIKKEIRGLIQRILMYLSSPSDVSKKELPMTLNTIVRGLTLLNASDLKGLYTEMKGMYAEDNLMVEMLKNIYFDAVSICGTTPSVLFLKETFKAGEMTKTQSLSFLSLLPHYVFTPTDEVLSALFDLIKGSEIKESVMLYNTALMAMSNLIQKACLDKYREATYPVNVFGEFCSPASKIVTDVWIPYLSKELQDCKDDDHRNVIIVSLGIMTHRHVVPILLPLIEGGGPMEVGSRNNYRNVTRLMALYSLGKVGKKNPEIIRPILLSIYSNPAESTDMRIAAVNTLLTLNAPMTYLHKIAARTWSEKDNTVLHFVYTSIYSYSMNSHVGSTESDIGTIEMIKKCQLILPLLKRVNGAWPPTTQIFSSDYLSAMDGGYKSRVSWSTNPRSFFPNDIYGQFKYLFGDVETTPFTASFKLNGLEKVYEKIAQLFWSSSKSYTHKSSSSPSYKTMASWTEAMKTQISSELNPEQIEYLSGFTKIEVERYTNLPTEYRKMIMELPEKQMHLLLSIASPDKRMEYMKLSPEELETMLRQLALQGGAHSKESREHAYRDEEHTEEHRAPEPSLSISDHLKYVKESLHEEWRKVIETLELEPRESEPHSFLAYLRFFDDVSFLGSITDFTRDVWQKRVEPFLRNPQMYASQLCGKIPLTFQKALNVAPSEMLIPSDMGFPIIVTSNLPVLLSLVGHIDVKCSASKPFFDFETSVIGTSSYQAMVGTFCPFTEELVSTGVKKDFSLNLPIHAHFSYDVASGYVSLSLKTNQIKTPLDLIYTGIKPFTLSDSIWSLRPRVTSPDFRVLRSFLPLSSMELPFGSTFGFTLKSILMGESRGYDYAYLMKTLKMYNYNPWNILRFFMSSSVSESGEPSVKYSEYRLQYNPLTSRTEEVDMKFGFGVATKNRGEEEIIYHYMNVKDISPESSSPSQKTSFGKWIPYIFSSGPLFSVPMHSSLQKSLGDVMTKKLNLETGIGATYHVSIVFKGHTPRSLEYEISGATGWDEDSSRTWRLEIKSYPNTPPMTQKVCLFGRATWPVLPTWDISLLRNMEISLGFTNTLGYGQSCNESRIEMRGSGRVSERQKLFALRSPASLECDRLIREGIPSGLSSPECEETRMLSKMMDELDVNIDYIRTPPTVKAFETRAMKALRLWFWPYVSHSEEFRRTRDTFGDKDRVNIRFAIHKAYETLDVSITKPKEHVIYKTIPIHPTARSFIPPLLDSWTSNWKRSMNVLTDYNWVSMCKMDKDWLRTYDNRSLPLHLDDCYHLVSGDCSPNYSFSILAKRFTHDHSKSLIIYVNKTKIEMTPEEDYYSRDLIIKVNDEIVTLERNTYKTVMGASGLLYLNFYKSVDSVIHFKVPERSIDLLFNGESLHIYSIPLLRNKMCGLCGNSNGKRMGDLAGPGNCIFSTPRVEVAAYRVPTTDCSPLETSVKEKLERERATCAKYTIIPTTFYNSFMYLVGDCAREKHIVMERLNEVCISKIPVTQCGAHCVPKPHRLIGKEIPFVCFPNGRMAELYRERAVQGIKIPELKSRSEQYVTSVLVPNTCVSGVTSGDWSNESSSPTN